jgi:hypothetical protein
MRPRDLARLLGGLGELHASGLAASARMNLCLHDDRAADAARDLFGFLRR